jgi:hypothetical protein
MPAPVDLTGASRSFRNNNPGNLRGPLAFAHGAIGTDADGFAIFPDIQTGQAAQAALWASPAYADKPLGPAIRRYGGLYGNQAGVDPSTTFSQLTPEQQQAFLARQQALEGYKPGAATGPPTLAPLPPTRPSSLPETMPAALPPQLDLEPHDGDPFAP